MASDFALLFRARRIWARRRQRIPWKQRRSHGRQDRGYQRRIEVSDEQVVEVSDDHRLVSPGSWISSSQSGKCPKPTKAIKTTKGRKFIASVKRSLCAQWLDTVLASFLVAEESVCVRLGKSRGDNVLGGGEYCLALFGCFALFFPSRSGWISKWGWDSLKGLD